MLFRIKCLVYQARFKTPADMMFFTSSTYGAVLDINLNHNKDMLD